MAAPRRKVSPFDKFQRCAATVHPWTGEMTAVHVLAESGDSADLKLPYASMKGCMAYPDGFEWSAPLSAVVEAPDGLVCPACAKAGRVAAA